MAGNSLGQAFRVTTAGESHGKALTAIVDGCPPGIELNETLLQVDLDRRKPGSSKFTTQRRETDKVSILSGVFEGRTTGTPIGLYIQNQDQKSKDYSEIAEKFRPNHADYAYQQKYGLRDYRGGGRSSARETAMRVAAGGIAKQILKQFKIHIKACMVQMGPIEAQNIHWNEVENNAFFFPDASQLTDLEDYIQAIRKKGDSIGALVRVEATGLFPGLGEPVFDRLDADIAHALMSINAVKGVAIGDGFDVVNQKGSEHRDELTPCGFLSNHSGGVTGGISTGQDIVASVALKPTSSILIAGETIDVHGNSTSVMTKGRHDPCVGIRAVPIVEAMVALVLVDHLLRHRGQNTDVTSQTPVI